METPPYRQWVCKRTQRSFTVDAGLEDGWLETLNRFDYILLRSICEGHPDGDRSASKKVMPILRLSVTASAVPALKAHGGLLESELESLFETSDFAAASTLQHGWSSFDDDEYFIHLDPITHRGSVEMEPWVRDWFSNAIKFLLKVDVTISRLVAQHCAKGIERK